MKPAWPMLRSPVKPKWMLRPMTAMATAAVPGDSISRIMPFRISWMLSMIRPSSADPLRLAEEALGPHQQEQDQDQQRGGVLEVARHPEHRRQLDDQPDDQRTHER